MFLCFVFSFRCSSKQIRLIGERHTDRRKEVQIHLLTASTASVLFIYSNYVGQEKGNFQFDLSNIVHHDVFSEKGSCQSRKLSITDKAVQGEQRKFCDFVKKYENLGSVA